MKDKIIEVCIYAFVLAVVFTILAGFYFVFLPFILFCAGLGLAIIVFEFLLNLSKKLYFKWEVRYEQNR